MYKISAASILAVILITTLRSQNKELAMVLSLAACAVLLFTGVRQFRTVLTYLEKIGDMANINATVLKVLIQVCTIGILTQICALFCNEAGESAMGKVVELCGSVTAVCTMLPLLDSVLDLVHGLLGG